MLNWRDLTFKNFLDPPEKERKREKDKGGKRERGRERK